MCSEIQSLVFLQLSVLCCTCGKFLQLSVYIMCGHLQSARCIWNCRLLRIWNKFASQWAEWILHPSELHKMAASTVTHNHIYKEFAWCLLNRDACTYLLSALTSALTVVSLNSSCLEKTMKYPLLTTATSQPSVADTQYSLVKGKIFIKTPRD